ncbi:aldo/keto reductase [Celeribacter sp.]|uniref:aldo/keto reductase n=1 Tax=Celeribacter sp. TaxID=1890673 RepID=UPI003A8E3BE2
MTQVSWGIIGPGSIAQNFADGLAQAPSGTLTAIASRSAARRAAFGDAHAIADDMRFADYAALCDAPDVDAVHIAVPHPFHAELALMALRAGKHVSVEKPAGLNAAEVTALVEAAAQENRFFMEAYMYLLHPQIARMIDIVRSGEIGDITHIRATFGFNAPFDASSRLYDPALAGGAILDVGGYPVSAARLVAGIDEGNFAMPTSVKGSGIIGASGVDEVAYGLLTFANGITAEIACAVARNMDNTIQVTGTKGSLTLPNPWVPGRNEGPSDTTIEITVDRTTREEHLQHPEMLFKFEAEAASQAILAGQVEMPYPGMSHQGSIGNNTVLDQWRKELGYKTFAEQDGVVRILPRCLPPGLPQVPRDNVDGVPNPMSRLVMGCDNRETPAEGAIVWDAWMEAGGNSFDTGFVYGGGLHEKVLGQWIKSRGAEKDITVIVKGAHSPYCFPRAIEAQLDMSLARLNLDHAPIYILHRDNEAVPVGEFVEAMAQLKDKGKVGIWGGSNWSTERFAQAVSYAKEHGLPAPCILNNNLSLAVMTKPVWDGCVTSNMPESLKFLRDNDVMHLSWSSQARGYFLPRDLRDRLPADTRPETCYGSDDNTERRERARELAAKYGVSAHNIATAWVLAQSFPSFALIGPRSPGEIASTLPALDLNLTADEVAWLNLER